MQVHDRFDVFERYSYTDHSRISKIAVAASADAYDITTYPGGYGFGFDGLRVSADVPIFGEAAPSRVETSRDSGELLINFNQGTPDAIDAAEMLRIARADGGINEVPKIETLTLPGDPGFDLFIELHAKLQKVHPVLLEALEPLCGRILPNTLKVRHKIGGTKYNHEERLMINERSSLLGVGDLATGGTEIIVELDATNYRSFDDRSEGSVVTSADMEYTTGGYRMVRDGRVTERVLHDEELPGFTSLQQCLSDLHS